MELTVGQIVFIVSQKNMSVYPMRVVEAISKQALNKDTSVSYVFEGPPPHDGSNRISSTELEGEVFSSADAAHRALTERAHASIAKIVGQARAKASEWFGIEPEQVHGQDSPMTEPKLEQEEVFVELPNGQRARLKHRE